MAGTKALRRIQIGKETTAGTAVAATVKWRGMGTIQDAREIRHVEEDIGYLGMTDRTYTAFHLARINFEDTPATFEQLPYLLQASIENDNPATDGSGRIYEYNVPTTALNTISTYTIEGGDNQQAEEMQYSFVESWRLAGSGQEAVMMSAVWVGRETTNATFTADPGNQAVEEVIFTKGTLYIDEPSGNVGATAVSSTLLGFELSYNSGIVPKFAANGQMYFDFIQYTQPELILRMTYEHNASAVAEKAKWRSETARLVRLQFNGSTLQTAGATYSTKAVRVDLAGKYETWDAISDQDGNDIVTCTIRARYEGTETLFANLYVVNILAALA